MKSYLVQVQHPCIEHDDVVYPNFITLDCVLAEDEHKALALAQSTHGHTHSKHLLTVEELA